MNELCAKLADARKIDERKAQLQDEESALKLLARGQVVVRARQVRSLEIDPAFLVPQARDALDAPRAATPLGRGRQRSKASSQDHGCIKSPEM